ncbi:hypothetical protein GCM10022243_18590 [Saccharothrix violaceirubra]|uniref:DUF3558 domain-containing protein n=1 Tax=Saccharothrix violaceirubra TaxID=413306 RepID=A0A7W7T290_9PSEU|nr:hypothetical protein [Saccharothrix violaceirubra]MBB4965234.1 hypothetical protein [Saccharothrix violaceirubra]
MQRSHGAAVAAVLLCGLTACAQPSDDRASTASSSEVAAGPVRASLCDRLKLADLTSWMKIGGSPVDQATCAAQGSGEARAYGRWTFPSGSVEYIEIVVQDDKRADGSRLFDELRTAYPAHEQRTVAGHYARVANTRGKTLINFPDLAEPVDIVIVTKSTSGTGAEETYAGIRTSHFGAFEQLVPALVGG